MPIGRSKQARGVWWLPGLMRADKADGHRGRKWSQSWHGCEPLAELTVTFPEPWNICWPQPSPVSVTWPPLTWGPGSSLVKESVLGLCDPRELMPGERSATFQWSRCSDVSTCHSVMARDFSGCRDIGLVTQVSCKAQGPRVIRGSCYFIQQEVSFFPE